MKQTTHNNSELAIRLLTRKGLADHWQLSTETLKRRERCGLLPFLKIGRGVRYRTIRYRATGSRCRSPTRRRVGRRCRMSARKQVALISYWPLGGGVTRIQTRHPSIANELRRLRRCFEFESSAARVIFCRRWLSLVGQAGRIV